MMIRVVLDDITKIQTEAIVNAANKTLLGGGGVDGAIHRAAGPELREYCRGLGGCNVGMAKLSPGFALPCEYIIHTVAPIWGKYTPEVADAYLASCYASCMTLAKENNITSIAFPCIGTGIYGFPFARACRIALNVLSQYDIDVTLVTFTQQEYDEYCSIMDETCHVCGDEAETSPLDGMVL